jgi:hypothetical protein
MQANLGESVRKLKAQSSKLKNSPKLQAPSRLAGHFLKTWQDHRRAAFDALSLGLLLNFEL